MTALTILRALRGGGSNFWCCMDFDKGYNPYN
jgi:hypothetical protein